MWNKVFKHQSKAILALLILLAFIYTYGCGVENISGGLWNLPTSTWFYLAILVPIIHQFYVLICWRLELYFKRISNTFGINGFKLYKIGFAILILLRPITITILAISSKNTIEINTTLTIVISILLFIPSTYLFYSVKKYFGMDRAFGIDHFEPEIIGNQTFVKKGIFKYTSNGMYIYGFLLLWIPGFLFKSESALIAALFNHIYIWVHYYYTELPDIKYIYGNKKN